MSTISRRVLVVVIVSLFLGVAAMLMSLEAYSVAKSIKTAPSATATRINLRQKFNWTVAEVIDVQGNLYAYLGYELPPLTGYYCLRIARWQNAWLDLTYSLTKYGLPLNVTLSPYKLQLYGWESDYLTATFFES